MELITLVWMVMAGMACGIVAATMVSLVVLALMRKPETDFPVATVNTRPR